MSRTATLGELVTITRGKTYQSALLDKPGPVLLGLASIARNGGFRDDSLRTYGGDSPDNLLVHPGELFASLKDVTQSADLLGSVARVPVNAPVGRLTQDTVRLDIVSHEVDPTYLYLALLTPQYRSFCRSHATGTTNLGLPREDFLAYEIPLPSLDEQRRIAAVLGALDDLIESHRVMARESVALARAIINHASVGGDHHRVGDVADVRRGLSYKGAGLSDRGMPMVNMGSAANFGWLKRNGWKYYIFDYKPRHVASGGDLIITNTEQTWRQEIIGWPMLVPSDVPEALFTHHTYLVDFRTEARWLRLPLWAFLFTGPARMVIDSSIRGTTVASLPIDAIENLSFPVPPAYDPSVPTAQALLESTWADEIAARDLSRTRDELLPLLMSGKVRVSDDFAVA